MEYTEYGTFEGDEYLVAYIALMDCSWSVHWIVVVIL